ALFGRAIDGLGPGPAHRAEKSGKLHEIGSMPWNRHAHKIQFCPFWVRLGHQWLVSRGTEEGPAQPQNPIGLGPGSLTVHPPWGLAAFPWKPRLHRSASQPEDGRGNDRNPNSGSPLQQFFGIGTDGLATDLDIGGTPIKKSVSQAKGRTVLGLPFV